MTHVQFLRGKKFNLKKYWKIEKMIVRKIEKNHKKIKNFQKLINRFQKNANFSYAPKTTPITIII